MASLPASSATIVLESILYFDVVSFHITKMSVLLPLCFHMQQNEHAIDPIELKFTLGVLGNYIESKVPLHRSIS